MSSRQATFDRSLADAVFDRLKAQYGSQKVGAMFADADVAVVRAEWTHALSQFAPAIVHEAVSAVVTTDSQWPPTLPQLVARCMAIRNRPGTVVKLGPPARSGEDIAAGKRQVERIRRLMAGAQRREEPRDPLAWAFRVKQRYEAGETIAHACYVMALEALITTGRLRIEDEEAAQ